MGIPYAKQKKNDSFTEDTKNGSAKEAAANEATDFNHGKANDLSGNLKNTANTSQGPGPTQGISHQIEPNNGNEAVLTSMLQVPTVDAQNREQSLNKAVNKSQDVDPVKIDPYIFTAERHASSGNTPGRVMKIPTGANDDLSVFFKHKPPAPVKQKTKPVQHQKRTTAPVQEQTKPVQQQTKPVQQQTKPVQQQTKPVQQQQNTTAAVQQQTKPVQQQTKPVQEQTKPVQQQAKPVQQQTKPVQQQTKPVQEQTKPVQEQTKPVQQQAKPVQEQAKPVQQQAKPVQEQAKPVQQQIKPVQEQAKPVQQQIKHVQEQTKPVQQQTIPVQQQTKPVQEQTKPVQQQTKPVQQQTKPVQEQAKPVQQQTKPVQEQAKPVQQQIKHVQEQTKPVQQQIKHVQEQTKPVQEQTKPVQQQTKPVQQQTKPVQEQTKPVQQQTIPVQQQTIPVQQQTIPVQQQTIPVQQQTKPVQEQKKPVQQQTKPVQQQTKPVQQQTKLVQQQTKPVQQQTKPVQQQTKPVQQQKKAPSPVLHVTVSQQRPTAKETTGAPQQTAQTVPPCDMATADSAHTSQVATQGLCRYGLHQVEHSSQLPASQMQASVHRLYSDVVRGVPTENLPRGTKAQIKLLRQKYSCALPHVNEVSTDLTCQATDKTHNTAEQSTATSPGMAEVPPDHSTQESHQSESQVNINALHQVTEHCLILTKRQREPAEGTVATEQESSEQQYYSTVEEITIQTHNEPQQISKPNKADDDTNGNASSCLLRVSVEALEPQVPAVEGMPTTAPNNAADHPTTAGAEPRVKSGLDPVSVPQNTDVKLETLNKNQPDEKTRNVTLKAEMNAKDGQVVKEEQEPAVHTEGRRHPFKVNQSCPHDVKRNPGKGLPPNVQKWCDEPPYHLCEPPWVTTARLAAFLALTKAQEEGDPPQ